MKANIGKHFWVLLVLVVALLGGGSCTHPKAEGLERLVNPMIGTDWVGNVYPGVSAPFGMVQLSPDNGLAGWDRISGYYYPDSTIAGFSHTHLSGTGAGDMYDISFMPVLLPALVDTLHRTSPHGEALAPIGVYSSFRHESEEAWAGYYSVRLDSYDIRVELTASPRVGLQRYTFERASDSACIMLNLSKAMNWDRTLGVHIEAVDSLTLAGYRLSSGWASRQMVYFRTRLSRQPDSLEIVRCERIEGADSIVSHDARLYYRVKEGEQIVLATALSGVDAEGAAMNLRAEAPHLDFDRHLADNTALWRKRLSSINVTDPSVSRGELTKLYTALYRSQLCPTLYSDIDGRYLGADSVVHRLDVGERHFSTFSLWDTYRAAHPLYNILYPEDNRQMVQSMIDFGLQNGGHLPVWNMWACETDMMIGYHSVPVIVEAILRGIYEPQDKASLVALLRSTAERKGYRGLDDYRDLGYVPADREPESLSKTIEYAYDDAATLALGRYWADSLLVRDYEPRAMSHRRLWDGASGFFRPRLASGAWRGGFSPFAYTKDVTESNAYQYLFAAHHDADGLMSLMGGADSLGTRLDRFFSEPTPQDVPLPIFSTGMIGQYAHGNEPSHHVIFMYNLARQPWRTSELVRRVCNELYTDRPDGLCGNEDCGQMSAWYVFAALGFYPLDSVSGRYELVTPRFESYELALPSGRTFRLTAKGCHDKPYIKAVRINGKPSTLSYLTYEQIVSGAEVELEMTAERGHCWY